MQTQTTEEGSKKSENSPSKRVNNFRHLKERGREEEEGS